MMINKITTLTEATKLVREGDMLALGGMTLYRRPVAFVRELIRQGRPLGNPSTARLNSPKSLPRAGLRTGDLTLLAFTASFASDLLVGAGLVSRVRSCYFGMEAFGLAPMFTKLATAGEVKVIEETEASIAFGLRATLAGVGFMPGQGWVETDLLKVRPDVQLVDDPYSDRRYAAFPAIKPNVAVIHARLADPYGNAVLGGNLAVDWELTMGSQQVIITAERVVDKLEERADIVGPRVTAVVEAPGGAKPTSCYPDYPLDSAEILHYVETCASGGFEDYLKEFLG
jgi:glutaconate CoA-transferase subunit A